MAPTPSNVRRAPFRGIWAALALTLPFAIKVYFPGAGVEVIFPSEPLIAVLFLGYLGLITRDRSRIWRTMVREANMLDIAVLAYLATLFLASCTAASGLVAWKAFIVQTVYIGTFYWATRFAPFGLRLHPYRSLLYYALAMLPIMAYSLLNQGLQGMDRAGSNHAPFPFFTDHTAYAAVLCFALPLFVAGTWKALRGPKDLPKASFFALISAGTTYALLYSFSRGAWLSAVVALLAGIISLQRERRWKIFLTLGLVCTLLPAAFLWIQHGPTHDASKADTGFVGTVRSIADVQHDRSTIDRIARWQAALSMFKERPWTGQGPGNYQFELHAHSPADPANARHVRGPVSDSALRPMMSWGGLLMMRDHAQRSISSGGTAHSEYFLALSEGGLFGFLAICALCGMVLMSGLFGRAPASSRMRTLRAVAFLGLCSYLVHACFNNFLDDIKLAFPFWISLSLFARTMEGRIDRRSPNA